MSESMPEGAIEPDIIPEPEETPSDQVCAATYSSIATLPSSQLCSYPSDPLGAIAACMSEARGSASCL